MGKKLEKLPAYHCRLCAKNAFPTEPGARPIPFPDEILRPTLSPEAVMHGVALPLFPMPPLFLTPSPSYTYLPRQHT